jgi:hypothetical protein
MVVRGLEFVVDCNCSSVVKIGEGSKFSEQDEMLPPRKDANSNLPNNLKIFLRSHTQFRRRRTLNAPNARRRENLKIT